MRKADDGKVIAIACVDINNAIGYQNNLLFNLVKDKRFFRNVTRHNYVIMGGNTLRSMNGYTLVNRYNVILSRTIKSIPQDHDYGNPRTIIVSSASYLRDLLQMPYYSHRFIIGGAQIYEEFIDDCDMVYLTTVMTKADKADAYFPNLNEHGFSIIHTVYDGKSLDRDKHKMFPIIIDVWSKDPNQVLSDKEIEALNEAHISDK